MHTNWAPLGPCGAQDRCRISPPRFLAESCKRRLNQGSFVSAVCLVVYFLWFVLCLCVYFCDLYWVFFLIVCLSVTVKWFTVKTASKMTYTVSSGALNSAQSNPVWWTVLFRQLHSPAVTVTYVKLCTRTKFRDPSFCSAGPAAWNSLTDELHRITDTHLFKRHLSQIQTISRTYCH